MRQHGLELFPDCRFALCTGMNGCTSAIPDIDRASPKKLPVQSVLARDFCTKKSIVDVPYFL